MLAASWPHPPPPELSDMLLALRDAGRDLASAVAAIDHASERETRLARCRDREQEVQRLTRAARAWLLVEQTDPHLTIRGHNVLGHADAALSACTRLRVRLHCHALA